MFYAYRRFLKTIAILLDLGREYMLKYQVSVPLAVICDVGSWSWIVWYMSLFTALILFQTESESRQHSGCICLKRRLIIKL